MILIEERIKKVKIKRVKSLIPLKRTGRGSRKAYE